MRSRRILIPAGWLLLAGCTAHGQAQTPKLLVSAANKTQSCGGIDFEKEHYQIGTVTVRGPFGFPWWTKFGWAKFGSTPTDLKMLEGKPFTLKTGVSRSLLPAERYFQSSFR